MSKDLIALRCVKCGAPLDIKEGSEFTKCSFCGFTQAMVDSKQYVEKLKGEIYKWMSEMVPTAALATGGMVDTVARHNLFAYNIRPRVAAEYALYKSKVSMLMSNYLVHLPFWKPPQTGIEDNPRDSFEKLARIESLSPLAVVDEDQKYYSEIALTICLYAYLANAFSLVKEKSEMSLIINNLKTIEDYFEKYGKKDERKAEYDRISATLRAYEAVKYLMEGDSRTAKAKSEESMALIRKAKDEAKTPQTAFMIPSIEKDIKNIETVKNLAEISSFYSEAGREPSEFLITMEKFTKLGEELREQKKFDVSFYGEITSIIKDIVASKTGVGQIQTIPGEGDILIPMWAIPTTYTFVTGALFMKKGKAVEDFILVSAVPASQPITDIFQDSGVGFFDRIKGKEATLSKGFLGEVLESVRPTSIPWSTKVLPPLITREQANRIYENYIQEIRNRTGGKVTLGVGEAKRLIFLHATRKGDDVNVPVLKDSPIRLYPYLGPLLDAAI